MNRSRQALRVGDADKTETVTPCSAVCAPSAVLRARARSRLRAASSRGTARAGSTSSPSPATPRPAVTTRASTGCSRSSRRPAARCTSVPCGSSTELLDVVAARPLRRGRRLRGRHPGADGRGRGRADRHRPHPELRARLPGAEATPAEPRGRPRRRDPARPRRRRAALAHRPRAPRAGGLGRALRPALRGASRLVRLRGDARPDGDPPAHAVSVRAAPRRSSGASPASPPRLRRAPASTGRT